MKGKIKTANEIRKIMKDNKMKIESKLKKEHKQNMKYTKNLAINDARNLLKKEIPELSVMFFDYSCKFNKKLHISYNIETYYNEFNKICNMYGYNTELQLCKEGLVYNTFCIKVSWEEQ